MSGNESQLIDRLLGFLQSPQAQGIAGGLLANSGPSMTQPTSFGQALGSGLLQGATFADQDRQRKREEAQAEETKRHNKQIEEINQMQQDVAKQKADAEVARNAQFGGILRSAGADILQNAGSQSNAPQQGILQSTGNPIVNNPDGSISTENSITVTEPRINGGRPTNISTMIDGEQLSDEDAIAYATTLASTGKQYPSFNSIKEAEEAAKARSAQLGRDYAGQIGALSPANMPTPPPMQSRPPPQMPAIPQGQVPRGTPQGEMVDVKIGGENVSVPRSNLNRARALYAAGDTVGAAKALTETLDSSKDNEVIQTAKYLYPDDIEKQREFIKEVKLKGGLGDEATKAVVTQQQKVITGVDTAMPSIDELIKLAEKDQVPYQGLGATVTSPNKQAKYQAIANQVIEPLLGSFGLNTNEHNAKTVAKQIERAPFETKDAYVKRLKELKKELAGRRKYASKITSLKGVEQLPGYSPSEETEQRPASDYSIDELEAIARGKKK